MEICSRAAFGPRSNEYCPFAGHGRFGWWLACFVAAAGLTSVAATPVVPPPGLLDQAIDATPASFGARLSHARTIPYPFEQVWPAAIRYLRVDRGFEVMDRDEEAGYVLFEFDLGDERRGQGSLEAFRTQDGSGRPSVRIQVSTSQGPVHLPHAIVDGLAAKIRTERGQPAPPPPPSEPPAKPPEPTSPPEPSAPAPTYAANDPARNR